MRLVVLGATGPAGRVLVDSALVQGHEVVAYVRNPDRLRPRPGLTVLAGRLDEPDRVGEAVRGAGAVVSLLGPGRDRASTAGLVPGTQVLVDQMRSAAVARLVATATPSAPDPADGRDLRLRAMVTAVRLVAPGAYGAIRGIAEVVRGSDLDWTLVRLPLLHDGLPPGPSRARRVGEPGGLRLSRTGLAQFLLRTATTGRHLHEAPLLADR